MNFRTTTEMSRGPRSGLTASVKALLWLLFLIPCVVQAQHSVERIVDGDTFELSNGKTVRLIGIDSYEKYMSDHLKRDAKKAGLDIETIRKLGEKASRYAQKLVNGKSIELTYDPANADTDHRGGYGRLLAYVWILDEEGEREYMINRRMVREGYARAYTKYPFKYEKEFRALEKEARKEKRGLWKRVDADGKK